MGELREEHRLAHGVCSQVSFKAEYFKGWDFNFENCVGCTRLGFLEYNMRSSSHEDVVDSFDAVRGRVDFSEVDWLHDSRASQQQGAISAPTGCRNDLTTSSENWFRGEVAFEHLKFDIFYWLFTERSFPCSPLKSLDDSRPNLVQSLLLRLIRDGVIN